MSLRVVRRIARQSQMSQWDFFNRFCRVGLAPPLCSLGRAHVTLLSGEATCCAFGYAGKWVWVVAFYPLFVQGLEFGYLLRVFLGQVSLLAEIVFYIVEEGAVEPELANQFPLPLEDGIVVLGFPMKAIALSVMRSVKYPSTSMGVSLWYASLTL